MADQYKLRAQQHADTNNHYYCPLCQFRFEQTLDVRLVVWYCMYVYKCLFQFIVSISVQWIPMVTAQCLWLVAQLTLLPVGCISPSDFKEPQTEPLLGERTVFWPLLFSCASSSISVSTVEMFRFFFGQSSSINLLLCDDFWWQFRHCVFSISLFILPFLS